MMVTTITPTFSGPLRVSFSPAQNLHNSYGVSQSRPGHLTFRPRNLLRPLDYNDSLETANWMILFNSGESPESVNPLFYPRPSLCTSEHDYCSCSPKPENHSGSAEHKHCLGSLVIHCGCTYENQHPTGKEKGRTANPTLWDIYSSNYETFVVHSSIHSNSVLPLAAFFICRRRSISAAKAAMMNCDVLSSRFLNNSISSTTLCGTLACNFCDLELVFVLDIAESSLCHRRTAYTESMAVGDSVHPSGASLYFFLWRRLISPCMAVTMNCPVVSPSSFTESIASTTSWGARACTFCDLELIALLAITGSPLFLWITVYREIIGIKLLTWSTVKPKVDYTLKCSMSKLARLDSVTSTSRASIHNVTEAYTMEFSHSTKTRPEKKYLWRFLALNRSDMCAKPCRISVEAPTEHDARRVLAPFFILSLSARLSAPGVCNA